jgi:hypothetical protein
MIHAIKHKKVSREIFKGNEDSLTSSIFERLMYLPQELVHYILEKALYDTIPNFDFHQFESIEFWPRWNSENTTNSKSVEPDIFIRTTEHDLIIEAKRYDSKQQYNGQWKNEIQAYYNEYDEDSKPLIFIALGGIHSTQTKTEEVSGHEIKIVKCTWIRILNTISDLYFQLENSVYSTNSNKAQSRILEDMILCFALFGFSTAPFFERFIKPVNINSNSINKLNQIWSK